MSECVSQYFLKCARDIAYQRVSQGMCQTELDFICDHVSSVISRFFVSKYNL